MKKDMVKKCVEFYMEIVSSISFRPVHFVLMIILFNASCAAQKGTGGFDEKGHEEDITSLRPKFSAPVDTSKKNASTDYHTLNAAPTKNVNKKVDAVLDSVSRLNLTRKFVDGYTIQIYSGQNREDAMNAKKKMSDLFGQTASLQYTQPKFRVTSGGYFTRLEAQKDLIRVKRSFSAAILVPEKILIK